MRPKKLPIHIVAKNASGGHLQIDGCYLFQMKILEKSVSHPFFVCKNIKNEGILGIDFIKHHGLSFDAEKNVPYFSRPDKKCNAILAKEIYLPARSATLASIHATAAGLQTLAIQIPGCPQIFRNECLVNADTTKKVSVYLNNVSAAPQRLPRGTPVGTLEMTNDDDISPWHEEESFSVQKTTPLISKSDFSKVKPFPTVLTESRKKEIFAQAKLDHLPSTIKAKYISLLLKFHECISLQEFDVGRCNAGQHSIPLKDENKPVFQKQFPLPMAHRLEISRQVKEWLRLGLVSQCESEFNSSLFLVKKRVPEGSEPRFRIVQDLRALNLQTAPSNFRLNRIDECLDRIAHKKSKIFSSIDLRHGYYNVGVSPKDRNKTAFWTADLGQLSWNVSPQGLVNLPATFSRIMNRIFRKQVATRNVEIYLDDILCHTQTHGEMLEILEQIFENLKNSGMKLNLKKTNLGANSIVYLGYEINEAGYSANPANIRTITHTLPPTTLRGVRSYIGLLNFYRHTIPNFSGLLKPLTQLTGNKSNWSGGLLPKDAMQAYEKSKAIMSRRPFIHHPDWNLDMHIYSDGSLGQVGANNGGISCCLVQYDSNNTKNPPKCLGFGSRSLKTHESSYSAFLLENLALSFAIDHFSKYVEGRPFFCHVDHSPMTKLNNTQKRTLTRLKEQLAEYTFTINYLKGDLHPCDHYSRHPLLKSEAPFEKKSCAPYEPATANIAHTEMMMRDSTHKEGGSHASSEKSALHEIGKSSIASIESVESDDIEPDQGPWMTRLDLVRQFQKTDPFIIQLRNFIETKAVPNSIFHKRLLKNIGPNCFIKDDLVFISLQRQGHLKKDLIFAPGQIQASIVAEAHSSKLFGHDKAAKTIERILSCWYWPGLAGDTVDYVNECDICIRNRKKSKTSSTFLKPLETATEPLQIVATDLFGPLKAQDGSKKYILTVVDTFSKHCEFIIIPNKSAEQVANAIFSRWICRFGMPVKLTSDQGKEYRSQLFNGLCKLLEIDHRFASVQHPRTNSAAEVLNKKIAAYLKAMHLKHPNDWETLIPSLQFSYNSAVTRATKMSPFNILHGLDPRTVLTSAKFATRNFYGENYQSELVKRLQSARELAIKNNLEYRLNYKKYFDDKVMPEAFKEGDLCYLHSPELIKINRKIRSPFLGPYVVLSRISDHNVVIQNLKSSRTKFVNIDRLRKTRADPISNHLGQSKTTVTAALQPEKNELTATGLQNESVTSPSFVEFDVKNEVQWLSDKPLPKPITIKAELQEENEAIDQSASDVVEPSTSQGLSTLEPSTSQSLSSKVSAKFPSPSKIGQEVINLLGKNKRATRANTKADNLVLPAAMAPPDICPTKKTTLQSKAKRSLEKSKK